MFRIMLAIYFTATLCLSNNPAVDSKRLYFETRWDQLVYDKDVVPVERLDKIRSISGFLDAHDANSGDKTFKTFGDLSIITLNLYRDVIAENETIESAENIRTILDEAHPTFLCLQGVDESLLERIRGKLKKHPHYQIANYEKYNIDLITGQRDFLPIIFDTSLVKIKNSGYFETENKKRMLYGSFLEINDFRREFETVAYTIINVDMFSSFNDVVSAQFSNIVSDISSYNEVNDHPVFIVGGIGTLPSNIKELIKTTYMNTIEADHNNEDLSKTTVHSGGQDDGIQRDLILLRDAEGIFELNYSRILRKFLASDHYPVHAIFSFGNGNKKTPKIKIIGQK